MTIPLARRMLSQGATDRAGLHRALVEHVSRRTPLPRAFVDAGVVSERALDELLAQSAAPTVRSVAPLSSLLDKLPEGLCARLLAVPIRVEPATGQVDVAAVDPFDPHIEAEVGFHLGMKVRLVRAPLALVEAALRRALVLPDEEVQASLSPRSLASTEKTRGSLTPTGSSLTAPRPPSIPDLDLLKDADLLGDEPAYDEDEEPVLLLSQLKSNLHPFPTPVPQSPRALDVATVAAMLRRAVSRDEVMDALLGGLRAVARRVGVLAVRKSEVHGFRCNEELAAARDFREIVVDLQEPSVFATALATGCYVGPIPYTPVHASLVRANHGTSGDVAVLPISVSGKPALLVFLDEIGDVMIATRRAEDLGRLAGEALGRLLAEGKK